MFIYVFISWFKKSTNIYLSILGSDTVLCAVDKEMSKMDKISTPLEFTSSWWGDNNYILGHNCYTED